jgi:formylmethanofuran dehydrogenase subunit D
VPVLRMQLHPIRTSKQGVQVNVGKDGDEYNSIVNMLSIHELDMQALGVAAGDQVTVRTEHGQADFICEQAKVPQGMLFVPYGPPTCKLMGGDTGGTGMPTSKGWEVEVEPVNDSVPNVDGT